MEDIAKRIASLSPKQLALLDQRLRGNHSPALAAPVSRRPGRGRRAPLSFAQERLWVLDQLRPGNPAYNLWLTVPLSGQVRADLVKGALDEIVRRHEVLRTTFAVSDGRPVQVIADALHLGLSVADLRGCPAPMRQMESASRISREAQQPFDLSRGPLVRALLLHLTDSEHLLLICMHHIISDGWSLNVLVGEFNALYAAALRGRPAALPEPALQYADFAVWQREYLKGEVADRLLEYWRRRLEGAPELLNLPTENPPPGVRSFQGAAQYWPLRRSTAARLKSFAQAARSTSFITLLAGFKALLSRYTGQEDIVVGSPIANRNRKELEPLIGFFVNTLVLRTAVPPELSFRELLGRVQDVTLDAHAHQDLPFERLVAELLTSRDPSHNPLFQVMFSVQSADNLGGLSQTLDALGDRDSFPDPPPPPAPAWVKFDLSLTFIDAGTGVLALWEYRTDLFSHALIAGMARHFDTLLGDSLAEPERPLSDFPLLSEDEQRQQLFEWNPAVTPRAESACLHELVEAQAERTPEEVAVVCGEERLTFTELNARANVLARRLVELGVGAEKRVGIAVGRSGHMVAGILAVLKAGAAYVPLDPSYPAARLAYMAEDAGVEVILTQESLLAPLREVTEALPVTLLPLDAPPAARATAHDASNLGRTAGPDNLAYVIYTSGSTGKPKGVMIPHRAIVNHMRWMLSEWQFRGDDRVLQRTAISFDASVWELFAPLMSGARLVLSKHGASGFEYVADEIVEQGVTVLQLVPSLLRVLLERGGLARCRTLRRVFCGGEALSSELVNSFYQQQKAELCNLYGPTEAAIDASWWRCQPGCARAVTPIGQPVSNAQMFILDKHLRLVPVGVTGELHIGGEGLARGYLNRPSLTAESFVPCPFGGTPGARLYRTGDLARYLPDGSVEFVGRADGQVKIRGFRIELAEIEAVLARQPDVKACVALDEDDGFGSRRVVAYATLKPGAHPNVADLQAALARTLPQHMVPAAFVFLDEFPLLPNGKLDRAALRHARPRAAEVAEEEEDGAPRTEVEEKLAKIWMEVLKLERLRVGDNFFALGGHSLLATQVVSRVRDTFGVELPLNRIFEAPTVATLAAGIEQLQAEGPAGQSEAALQLGGEHSRLTERIDQLSEEEIDALLLELKNGAGNSAR